jgi:hypothetical protein
MAEQQFASSSVQTGVKTVDNFAATGDGDLKRWGIFH